MAVSNIFGIFSPTWGNDPIWRAYFWNGWFNHHLGKMARVFFWGGKGRLSKPTPPPSSLVVHSDSVRLGRFHLVVLPGMSGKAQEQGGDSSWKTKKKRPGHKMKNWILSSLVLFFLLCVFFFILPNFIKMQWIKMSQTPGPCFSGFLVWIELELLKLAWESWPLLAFHWWGWPSHA